MNYLNKIIVYILLCFVAIPAQGQGLEKIINTPIPGNASPNIYYARDRVVFKPGTTFKPDNGNYKLRAYVDPHIIEPAIVTPNPNGAGILDRAILNTNLEVGNTPGSAMITMEGKSVYTIPIYTPPGTAGMEPGVSMQYVSGTDGGVLGYGWDIIGLSSVNRVPQNIHFDNKTQAVTFTNADGFSFDGQRLIQLHDGDGTLYGTESESFTQVKAHGTQGNGPEWFEATTKEGTVIEFGRTTDSRVESNGTILSWKINKVIDANGNYMLYQYLKEVDETVISKITYTGNETASLVPYNSIEFYYSRRPDVVTRYISGKKMVSSLMLRMVKSFAESKAAKTYEFKYEKDLYSKLIEVQETGVTGEKYNSTLINWNGSGHVAEKKDLPGDLLIVGHYKDYPPITKGDLDGDGKTDFIFFDPNYNQSGAHYLLLLSSAPTQYVILNYMPATQPVINMIDFDGDNKDELYLMVEDGTNFKFYGFDINPTTYAQTAVTNEITNKLIHQLKPASGGIIISESIALVPINNTGYIGNMGIVLLRVIQRSGEQPHHSIADVIRPSGNNLILPTGFSETTAFRTFHFIDFNGDGKTEIVELKESPAAVTTFNDNNPYIRVYEYNNATTTYTQVYSSGALLSYYDFADFGDFNGDGNADMLVHSRKNFYAGNTWSLLYSTGKGFNAIDFTQLDNLQSITQSVCINDFNNDGKTDVYFVPMKNKLTLLKSNGVEFEQTDFVIKGLVTDRALYFNDYDGNGLTDIYAQLNAVSSNGQVSPSVQKYSFILFKQGELHNTVAKVLDGMNNISAFGYNVIIGKTRHPFTHDVFVSYPRSQFGVINSPTLQATGLTKTNYSGGWYERLHFDYGNALYSKSGKGFLGYDAVTKTTTVFNESRTIITDERTLYQMNLVDEFLYPASTVKAFAGNLDNPNISSVTYEYADAAMVENHRYWHRLTKRTDKDFRQDITSVTNYTLYDNSGNVIQQNEVNNGSPTITITNSLYANVTGAYANRLTSQTITRQAYGEDVGNPDSYTRNVTYSYDGKGNLITVMQDPSLDQTLTTTYDYNLCGLLTKETVSAQGLTSRISRYIYDDKKRFKVMEYNSLNQVTESIYEPVFGKVTAQKDVDGKVIAFKYNGMGRLLESTDKAGITTTFTKKWETATSTVNTYIETQATPLTPLSKTWYDNLNRKVKTAIVNANGEELLVDYTINNLFQLEKQSKPYTASQSPTKFITYAYDNYGMPTQVNDDGRITNITYPDSKTTRTTLVNPLDANLNQFISKTINNDGQWATVTDKAGTITYTYYKNGKVKDINAVGAITHMEYDDYARLKKNDDPDAGLLQYVYNAYSELTKQTDAQGRITEMEYDVAGRVTKKSVAASSTATQKRVTTYVYASSGSGINQPLSVSNPDVTQTFSYDQLGRTASISENITGNLFTTSYIYNDAGDISRITYPSGFAVTHEYDEQGKLRKLLNTVTRQPIWQARYYDDRNQLTTAILGGNLPYSYTYDANYMLTGVTLKNTDNTPMYQQQYEFNYTTGNLTWRKDMLKSAPGSEERLKETFTYDALNRLTSATVNNADAASSITMSYAANGNIDSKSNVSTGRYDYTGSNPHALTGINDLTVPIPSFTQTATYNAEDRVTNITQNNDVIAFIYGADDERRKTEWKLNNITQSEKYYSGDYEKETTPTGTNLYHYIYSPYGLAAIMIKDGTTESLYFPCTDHLGTINALVDEHGRMAEEFNTDAWGTRRNPADWSYTSVPAPKHINRCYTGHEHLDQFGIINMNARLYDPFVGRVLSPDNYLQDETNSQNYNRYSYALNNPSNYNDPTGNIISNGNWTSVADGEDAFAFQGYDLNLEIDKGIHNGGGGGQGEVKGNTLSPQMTEATGDPQPEKGTVGDRWHYVIPLVGPALQSGDNLARGNYLEAISYFGFALFDVFTFGEATAIRVATARTATSAAKTATTTGYRYMSREELNVIRGIGNNSGKGFLRGAAAGETYFTKDVYKSATKAQSRLSLPVAPAIRAEFEILNRPRFVKYGSKVFRANDMPGRGAEFMTLDRVKVRLINWQPLLK